MLCGGRILADGFALRSNLDIARLGLLACFKGFTKNVAAFFLNGFVYKSLALLHRAVAQRTGLLFLFRARPCLADNGLQRGFEGSIKSFLRSGLRGEKICHRSHVRL